MITEKEQKSSNDFCCKNCNYFTSRKSQYERHISTDKHKRLQNNDAGTILNKKYICECGREYKYRQGLYNHRKTCKGEKKETAIIENEENVDYKSMFFEIIKKNNEFQDLLMKQSQQISELIPKVGNNNNNTINNKNKFNINVFLNEKCKDALSLDEFIDKIEVSMKNLLTTKEKGQVNGISNIIMENMNKLSLYERPLHCTDKKRETLYIKNDTWEKDKDKEKTKSMLKGIQSQQFKSMQKWIKEHPNYMNDDKLKHEYMILVNKCSSSLNDHEKKVLKNVCDNIYINDDNIIID